VLGVVVGDGVAAGAGVTFVVSIRIFQSSPSRMTDQNPLICALSGFLEPVCPMFLDSLPTENPSFFLDKNRLSN
jgi:hypothetical protein